MRFAARSTDIAYRMHVNYNAAMLPDRTTHEHTTLQTGDAAAENCPRRIVRRFTTHLISRRLSFSSDTYDKLPWNSIATRTTSQRTTLAALLQTIFSDADLTTAASLLLLPSRSRSINRNAFYALPPPSAALDAPYRITIAPSWRETYHLSTFANAIAYTGLRSMYRCRLGGRLLCNDVLGLGRDETLPTGGGLRTYYNLHGSWRGGANWRDTLRCAA